MSGCFDKCECFDIMCTVFTVFSYCFLHVCLFVLVASVRTTATE